MLFGKTHQKVSIRMHTEAMYDNVNLHTGKHTCREMQRDLNSAAILHTSMQASENMHEKSTSTKGEETKEYMQGSHASF